MKRFFPVLLALLLMVSTLAIPCAATPSEDQEVFFMDDGSYCVVTITTVNTRASDRVSGYKTYKYYNSNDVLQWTYKLNATFTYAPGVSAECIGSIGDVTIENKRWSYASQVASADGATARGQVTMKYKYLGVTTLTIPVDITITCDTYGNLT